MKKLILISMAVLILLANAAYAGHKRRQSCCPRPGNDKAHEAEASSRSVVPPEAILFADTLLETRDGKKSYDAGPHSTEMVALNRRFAILHSVSTISNLAGYLASLYYGFVLAAYI